MMTYEWRCGVVGGVVLEHADAGSMIRLTNRFCGLNYDYIAISHSDEPFFGITNLHLPLSLS